MRKKKGGKEREEGGKREKRGKFTTRGVEQKKINKRGKRK